MPTEASLRLIGASALTALALASACKKGAGSSKEKIEAQIPPANEQVIDAAPPDATQNLSLSPARPLAKTPLGLPPAPTAEHNPTTANKVALGALLFVDPKLSGASMSCQTCHQKGKGFASDQAVDKTALGQLNLRHTPSLWNAAYQSEYYWDGREDLLERAILGHWKGQLGIRPEDAVQALAQNPHYLAHAKRSFKAPLTVNSAAEALAAFVRSLGRGASAWDRYEAGERDAVTKDAILGFRIFSERAGCATCHAPPLYTDFDFASMKLDGPDPGRESVTGLVQDRGAFKTPSLRGLLHTAPYFHDGRAKTLEIVVDYKDQLLGLKLTSDEKKHLLAFLHALSKDAVDVELPEAPPAYDPPSPYEDTRDE